MSDAHLLAHLAPFMIWSIVSLGWFGLGLWVGGRTRSGRVVLPNIDPAGWYNALTGKKVPPGGESELDGEPKSSSDRYSAATMPGAAPQRIR